MHEAKIEVVPYSSAWPRRFASEFASLTAALQPWLAGTIEHIGSTAVPGLAAKPVIDIMAPVRGLAESRAAIPAAEALGYAYFPYKSEVMHWFCKPSPAHRTHHLHLVPVNSELWCARLAFRDTLRRNPQVAAEYQTLKLHLAALHPADREAYTEGKTPFIEAILAAVKRSAA